MSTELIPIDQIKFKELAAAIKVLNESGLVEKKIPTVGVSRDELVKQFVNAVQAIPDDPDTGDWTGPAEVGNYYMSLLAPAATKEKEKTSGSKKDKGATKGAGAKDKGEAKPGVIASILDIIKEKGPVDLAGIKQELATKFPDRDAAKTAKTVYAQLGGKIRPLRMEVQKNIAFDIVDGKFSIKNIS